MNMPKVLRDDAISVYRPYTTSVLIVRDCELNSCEILAVQPPPPKDKPAVLFCFMTMSVTSLFMPMTLEWSQNSFRSLCRKDTVISHVSRAGRGHAQAIKKVTAHPA